MTTEAVESCTIETLSAPDSDSVFDPSDDEPLLRRSVKHVTQSTDDETGSDANSPQVFIAANPTPIPEAPDLPQVLVNETTKPSGGLEDVFCNMHKSISNLRKSPWVLSRSKDIQHHLVIIENLLRSDDKLKMVARLENSNPVQTEMRYFVIVSTEISSDDMEDENREENVILGVDIENDAVSVNGLDAAEDGEAKVGLIVPITGSLSINLHGESGFTVSTKRRIFEFKPTNVQAMWSAINCLIHCVKAEKQRLVLSLEERFAWVNVYKLTAGQDSVNEWNRLPNIESDKNDRNYTHLSPEKREVVRQIRIRLRDIMMKADLDDLTVLTVREKLESQMEIDLREYKQVINEEMMVVMRQMDSPSQIADYLFLGSEWNASNLEELQNNRVRGVLNVTQEIDNFFPGMFDYYNIRVHDEESTDLLRHWQDSYKFISEVRKKNGKILVHCKMGVSRSASTVIAYLMKEKGWSVYTALGYVKDRRSCVQPNPGFMNQLFVYEGILKASQLKFGRRRMKRCRSCSADNLDKIDEGLDAVDSGTANYKKATENDYVINAGNSREDITSSITSIMDPPKTMLAARPCFLPMHRKGSIVPVEEEAPLAGNGLTSPRKSCSFAPTLTANISVSLRRSASWPRLRCDVIAASTHREPNLDNSSPITPVTPSNEWLSFLGTSNEEECGNDADTNGNQKLHKRVSFQRSKTLRL